MIVKIHEIGQIADSEITFAVVCAEYKSKWIFAKHKARDTWEIPGGKRDKGEDLLSTAKRELNEETGATDFELTEICDYSVTKENITTYGRLYYAIVKKIDQNLNSEMEKVEFFDKIPEALTYPAIQPILFEKIAIWKSESKNINSNN